MADRDSSAPQRVRWLWWLVLSLFVVGVRDPNDLVFPPQYSVSSNNSFLFSFFKDFEIGPERWCILNRNSLGRRLLFLELQLTSDEVKFSGKVVRQAELLRRLFRRD